MIQCPGRYSGFGAAEAVAARWIDLLTASGFVDPDFYHAAAISGDGLRILATEPRTLNDTNSVSIALSPP